MKTLNGTPKTLLGAIENGHKNAEEGFEEATIHAHVRDFLAQKFSAAFMLAEGSTNPAAALDILTALWNDCTGERKTRS